MYVKVHDGIIIRNSKTISVILNESTFEINGTIMLMSGSFLNTSTICNQIDYNFMLDIVLMYCILVGKTQADILRV